MSVLLLRLAGPMQSWGTQSRFSVRDTGLEPSRSGVVGLLCAAMGQRRDQPLDNLSPLKLKMGVRVDREGWMARDFQTAGGYHRTGEGYGVIRADGKPGDTVTSPRYYLADADFLVGLEGDHELLRQLDDKLQRPVWQLYLGRKAFVPGYPVPVGVLSEPAGSLYDVLQNYPWRRRQPSEKPPDHLRVVIETPFGEGDEVRNDVPFSFAERRFTVRHVKTLFVPPKLANNEENLLCS